MEFNQEAAGQQSTSRKLFTFDGKQGTVMKTLVVMGTGALVYGAYCAAGRLYQAYQNAKQEVTGPILSGATSAPAAEATAAPAEEGQHEGVGPATAAASAAAKGKK